MLPQVRSTLTYNTHTQEGDLCPVSLSLSAVIYVLLCCGHDCPGRGTPLPCPGCALSVTLSDRLLIRLRILQVTNGPSGVPHCPTMPPGIHNQETPAHPRPNTRRSCPFQCVWVNERELEWEKERKKETKKGRKKEGKGERGYPEGTTVSTQVEGQTKMDISINLWRENWGVPGERKEGRSGVSRVR